MSTLILFVVGCLFSITALKYFSIPYILISIYWLSLFIFLTLTTKKTVKQSVWFNLAFAVFLLGSLEVYSYFSIHAQEIERGKFRYEGINKGYYTSNEILGYGPSKDTTIVSRKFYNDQLIYDATYTIGNDGLRITPSTTLHYDNECIIFFGGSFTFGEGVSDYSAMPYIVGSLQSNKVHNFGFSGYGPHQMLAAIENDMIDCKPKLVIYQTTPEHVARSAGYSSWDKHGPKYIMKNGRLIYDGHFDDHVISFPFKNKIERQLSKSYFYRKFLLRKDRYTITDYDIRLFLKIVNTARSKLAEKFPGVEFHVILWDREPGEDSYSTFLKMRDGFKSLSIKYHLVSDIIPEYSENKAKYLINSTHDRHPNPIAHQLIAEYVVKDIIR